MIPASREKGRGAYRDLMYNYINDVKDIAHKIPGRANKAFSTLASFPVLDLGLFNYLHVRKRRVSTKNGTFTMEASVTAGDENSIKIAYWYAGEADYSVVLNAGSNNNVDIVLYEVDDFNIGSGNYIDGRLSIANGGTTIGDNNILIDFSPEVQAGSTIYGYPELSELMFETEVASIAIEGSTEIEVADTSKIMLGGEIFFGTLGAAFADRIVTSIVGNMVGFETPLTSKEVTIVASRVFNHYPETVEVFNSTLAENVDQGSKRIIVSDLGSLHLRDITINGAFQTKAFFQRSSDNMVIIRDATDYAYLSGTPVVSDGIYPYLPWDTAISLDSGSTYFVDNVKDSAYIGRVTNVEGTDYSIIGFTDSTITLDSAVPGITSSFSFPAVSEAPGGGPSSTKLSVNAAGNSLDITVEDASTFFVGQTVRISEIVKLFTVDSIAGNVITLTDMIFGTSVNNSFYVGVVELPIDIATTKANIEAGALDLHTYIFGGP